MTPTARVAIIDDEPDMNDVIVDFLTSIGVQSQSFTEAEKALVAIGDGTGWSLVLSDIRMPGMNGPELLNKLNEAGVQTPVVFMSGHIDKNLRESAISKGARGVLYKPFNFQEIVEFLKK